MSKILSKRLTAAAAYPAGTPVYESSAGVATASANGEADTLGILAASVASGGECQIVHEGSANAIIHAAAVAGEWGIARGGRVESLTRAEVDTAYAGTSMVIVGTFADDGTAQGELVNLNVRPFLYSAPV